jgi:hypothetical protein
VTANVLSKGHAFTLLCNYTLGTVQPQAAAPGMRGVAETNRCSEQASERASSDQLDWNNALFHLPALYLALGAAAVCVRSLASSERAYARVKIFPAASHSLAVFCDVRSLFSFSLFTAAILHRFLAECYI